MSIDLNKEGRLIIAMGIGTDVTGKSAALAVQNAISQALQYSSLSILKNMNISEDQIRVKVSVGIKDSTGVSAADIVLPFAPAPEIHIVDGGMDVVDPESGARQILATTAIEVFLPKQPGWKLRS
ncbi:Lin0512 family protein [Epibacterium ulvae]|uniref:Lin0512 family protein n=1 Tax=Epibacterium ulvae TaxID=1156985 RepID=UPI002493506B|nr:Lin0512 family protein [Epibacterium ulvae]